jgi:erythronate-4-phosphate dehydrogenase
MSRIIIDENIAYANEAFSQFGDITLLPGNEIINSKLKKAEILIVRSVTKVDKTLLKNTPVKFVGTTTIGTDHIDINYLKENSIAFADAKGCNAYSVAEYVIASLVHLAVEYNFRLKEKNIAIIGVGNIGSKVAVFAEALGMNVLLNDPPLQRGGDKRKFVELDQALNADIVTLHVPLNKQGIDKTYHLFDDEILNRINNGAILINTSRGSVIDNVALFDLNKKKNLRTVLDVWENEPDISVDLLDNVMIGTPHIAGYSHEGKVNGTLMIYNSLCEYLGERKSFQPRQENFPGDKIILEHPTSIEHSLNTAISKIYDVKKDSEMLKKVSSMKKHERGLFFSKLRKNYPIRREFNNYTIQLNKEDKAIKRILEQLRFKIIS